MTVMLLNEEKRAMIPFVEKVLKVQRVRKVLTFLKCDDHASAYRHIREPSEPLVPSEPYDSGLNEMKKFLFSPLEP